MNYKEKPRKEMITELAELREWNAQSKKELTKYRKTEKELLNFINLSSDAFILVGLDGKLKSIHIMFCKTILGCDPEELVGRSCIEFITRFVHPHDLTKTIEVAQNGSKGNFINNLENRYLCKDGSIKWYKWTHNFLVNNSLFFVVGHDITEQKNAEENLKKSNDQLNDILESFDDIFFAIDSQWRFTYYNKGAERIYKRNRREVIGKNIWDVFTKYVGTDFYRNSFKAMNNRVVVHTEGKGIYTNEWVEIHIYPSNDGISIHFRIISERKRMAIALSESEGRNRQLVELSPDTIIVHDQGNILFMNRSGANLLGFKEPKELYGKNLLEFIHPDYCEICKIRYQLEIENNTVPFMEMKYIRSDGTIIYVETTEACLIYQGKKCIQVVVRDITSRKLMQENLRLSEERFFNVFNASPVSMTIHTYDKEIFIEVNETCLQMHGYSRDEFIGRSIQELNLWVDMRDCERFHQEISKKGCFYNHEIKSYKKSAEIFTALLSGVVIDINGEKCVLVIKTDITELRQYQKEISRLDRLNLIGEMAAGIAHEVRNPMTTVRGYLQLLKYKREFLAFESQFELMINEIDRANSIISEFLSLAKTDIFETEICNLNDLIAKILPLIEADTYTKNMKMIFEPGEIPHAHLNTKEIIQLILNLCRNGLEAMNEGGCLTLKTFKEGQNVVLSVVDEGIGIPPENLDKLGKPFFSTKDYGTGLGLASCYNIATRHNAIIDIDTSPSGTTFFIRFSCAMQKN